MEEILGNLLQGNAVLLVLIAVFSNAKAREWIITKLFNGNGNGASSKELIDLKTRITYLQDNHLHTVAEKLDDIKELLERHIDLEQKNYEKQIENYYKLVGKIDERRN